MSFFYSYSRWFSAFRFSSYLWRFSFFFYNYRIQFLSFSILVSRFLTFLLFSYRFLRKDSLFSFSISSRFFISLFCVYKRRFYCYKLLILYCSFFIAPAMAELSSPHFYFLSLEVAKFYVDRSWRGGCDLESIKVIFSFAFWIELERILSMFALFSGLDFFSRCSIMDCTKLYCSAKFLYISFNLSADIL